MEENKWIVVTGGTKGIGKAILESFMNEGFNAITCARNKTDLEFLATEVSKKYPTQRFLTMPADLSQKDSCLGFGRFVTGVISGPDVLVNNTGVFVPGQIHTEPDGVLENMMNTNLYSAYYLSRYLIPGMVERRKGHLFNICSTASITPYINGGSYCISKYALLGMTKVLREEMKEHQVRVTAVLPGATFTASWEGVNLPESRFMKASDIGEAVVGCWKLSHHTVVEELLLRPLAGDI